MVNVYCILLWYNRNECWLFWFFFCLLEQSLILILQPFRYMYIWFNYQCNMFFLTMIQDSIKLMFLNLLKDISTQGTYVILCAWWLGPTLQKLPLPPPPPPLPTPMGGIHIFLFLACWHKLFVCASHPKLKIYINRELSIILIWFFKSLSLNLPVVCKNLQLFKL